MARSGDVWDVNQHADNKTYDKEAVMEVVAEVIAESGKGIAFKRICSMRSKLQKPNL
ncbi:MAG: hypothetical protein LLG02_11760 [Pelosinus sp.]|nr:hypothetical protein [Pelosinus sp.]